MKRFTYVETKQMAPRNGVKYATTYYKQHPKQREEMSKWLQAQIREIAGLAEINLELSEAIFQPLKGFPKSKGSNRSLAELLKDMMGECRGVKRNGKAKDFASAPIERWNKFFKGTKWEFYLEFGTPYSAPETTFGEMFSDT